MKQIWMQVVGPAADDAGLGGVLARRDARPEPRHPRQSPGKLLHTWIILVVEKQYLE